MYRHAAWGGQVVFLVSPTSTVQSMIIQDALALAVPESVDFARDSTPRQVLDNLSMCLSRTLDIVFALPEEGAHPSLVGLRDFWALAQTRDYAALWRGWLALDVAVHNEWIETLNAAFDAYPRLNTYAAPALIQPGAPGDETLEHADPNS